jgi:hypothetical protein
MLKTNIAAPPKNCECTDRRPCGKTDTRVPASPAGDRSQNCPAWGQTSGHARRGTDLSTRRRTDLRTPPTAWGQTSELPGMGTDLRTARHGDRPQDTQITSDRQGGPSNPFPLFLFPQTALSLQCAYLYAIFINGGPARGRGDPMHDGEKAETQKRRRRETCHAKQESNPTTLKSITTA